MDGERLRSSAQLLKAFAHPTRLQILAELLKGVRCVTDIGELLPVTQVNVSQHLTVLRSVKLVDFCQDGALRCYYLTRPELVRQMLTVLATDYPEVRRTVEDIRAEKARCETPRQVERSPV